MLTKISHSHGVESADEIQFRTSFNYMFPLLQESPACLLPETAATVEALKALGAAMVDPGNQSDQRPDIDSNIPAVMTYFGQFIDHDITANTDREPGSDTQDKPGAGQVFDGNGELLPDFAPSPVACILREVTNGRRPLLDLDSLYGDGPGLIGPHIGLRASALYGTDYRMRVNRRPGYIDLPRIGRTALIADKRNDENLNISQLHAAFLAFHNVVMDSLHGSDDVTRYIRARQIVRWCYQYVVVNDYLNQVCHPAVVEDTIRNGPRYFGPAIDGGTIFMPFEFSVAAFRFGHSMIRPFYRVNDQRTKNIDELFFPSGTFQAEDMLVSTGASQFELKQEFVLRWSNFVSMRHRIAASPQMARRIDAKLAKGLFDLAFEQHQGLTRMLAQRNLLRGYRLRIPTGQAVAAAMGIIPLSEAELLIHESQAVADAFAAGGFGSRTPLWYYVLKEADRHTGGQSLGAVGSRLVAECLVGLVKRDPNSYMNNPHHPDVTPDGIRLFIDNEFRTVGSLADILEVAGVPI